MCFIPYFAIQSTIHPTAKTTSKVGLSGANSCKGEVRVNNKEKTLLTILKVVLLFLIISMLGIVTIKFVKASIFQKKTKEPALSIITIKPAITSTPVLDNQASNGAILENGPEDKKVIAITFDDGPHPRYTLLILDLLKQYNVKATFFVIGKHAELYPEVLIREVKEGHEIGNHTFSHIDIRKISKEKIQEEFDKTQNIILSIIGNKPKLFRPPFGFYNKSVIDIANKEKCQIVIWSTHQDSRGWDSPGAEKIVETVLSETRNGGYHFAT